METPTSLLVLYSSGSLFPPCHPSSKQHLIIQSFTKSTLLLPEHTAILFRRANVHKRIKTHKWQSLYLLILQFFSSVAQRHSYDVIGRMCVSCQSNPFFFLSTFDYHLSWLCIENIKIARPPKSTMTQLSSFTVAQSSFVSSKPPPADKTKTKNCFLNR